MLSRLDPIWYQKDCRIFFAAIRILVDKKVIAINGEEMVNNLQKIAVSATDGDENSSAKEDLHNFSVEHENNSTDRA